MDVEFKDVQKIVKQCNQGIRRVNTARTKSINQKKDEGVSYDVLRMLEGNISLLDEMLPVEGQKDIKTMKVFDDIASRGSAITITYNQGLRDKYEEDGLRRVLKNTIGIICFNHLIECRMILLPDVDEGGNFHYHGVINMRNQDRVKFKRNITRSIGFMKMQCITDVGKWQEYCYKKEITEDYREKYSIIMDK